MKYLTTTDLDKPRTRRLRKKLRVGEFQEMGFEFEIEREPTSGAGDTFLDELIDFVESCGWQCGGGGDRSHFSGFLSKDRRGSLVQSDREQLKTWLADRPWCRGYEIGELGDCWHGW